MDCGYPYEPVSSTESLLLDNSNDIPTQSDENADGNPPTHATVLNFDQDNMVAWRTAVGDSPITDDAGSLQGNNDMTRGVNTTTIQTLQPPNEAAANFQTPVITPTSKVTTQRSPSAQTQSEAACADNTKGGPSGANRAAKETVANTCTPTAQSPPYDTVSSDTTSRTIIPRLPDNVRAPPSK